MTIELTNLVIHPFGSQRSTIVVARAACILKRFQQSWLEGILNPGIGSKHETLFS